MAGPAACATDGTYLGFFCPELGPEKMEKKNDINAVTNIAGVAQMLKKKSLIFGFCFKIHTKSFTSPLINTCECVVPYCCQLGEVLAKQQKRFDLQLSQYTHCTTATIYTR